MKNSGIKASDRQTINVAAEHQQQLKEWRLRQLSAWRSCSGGSTAHRCAGDASAAMTASAQISGIIIKP